MEISALNASLKYASQRSATEPAEPAPGAAKFAGRAADDFAETLRRGEETAIGSLTGDADPHELVQALAQAELAVETAVAVRNKVVEAYQEILRMPI